MQLIFLLLWFIALGIWLTVVYFIRTQLRTIDAIRPRTTYVYIALIVTCLVLFGVALMNIINYNDGARQAPSSNGTTTTTEQPSPTRSTSNEKIY